MKIIFLDIDGVLNVYPQGKDEYGSIFHKHFIQNLKRLIDSTGAKIVISSTWRYSGLSVMKEMWDKRGLPGEVIDITPIHKGQGIRGDEIDEWLMSNDHIEKYVILDDDDDFTPEQMPYFVKTSGNKHHFDYVDHGAYGLTKEYTDIAISILNK